jgi:hypothetical protein
MTNERVSETRTCRRQQWFANSKMKNKKKVPRINYMAAAIITRSSDQFPRLILSRSRVFRLSVRQRARSANLIVHFFFLSGGKNSIPYPLSTCTGALNALNVVSYKAQ